MKYILKLAIQDVKFQQVLKFLFFQKKHNTHLTFEDQHDARPLL